MSIEPNAPRDWPPSALYRISFIIYIKVETLCPRYVFDRKLNFFLKKFHLDLDQINSGYYFPRLSVCVLVIYM